MSILELDSPFATTPAPARPPLALPRARGDEPTVKQHERAAQAAARLVTAHIPAGVDAGDDIAVGLRYSGLAGDQHLTGSGRMFAGEPDGAVFAAMLAIADPLVVLTVSRSGRIASHWALVPGGPSVTARADALRFIRATRADGELVLRPGDLPEMPALDLTGATWSRDDEQEWQLFEDLATLEEWSGQAVPMPGELTGEQVAEITQAATWVRTERINASLTGPLRFTVASGRDVASMDELRLHRHFDVAISGLELPLGTGDVRIAVDHVRVVASNAQGHTKLVARPRHEDIVFYLNPPPGRREPAQRTQRPAPQPGAPQPPDAELSVPVAVPTSKELDKVLADLHARPATSAPSSENLLDELRGERV